jgi:predicted dehydrogenase
MGREFASATARWCHVLGTESRPEIVAVSDRQLAAFDWFRQHFPSIGQFALDYHELLANAAVEAV